MDEFQILSIVSTEIYVILYFIALILINFSLKIDIEQSILLSLD